MTVKRITLTDTETGLPITMIADDVVAYSPAQVWQGQPGLGVTSRGCRVWCRGVSHLNDSTPNYFSVEQSYQEIGNLLA